MMHGFEWLRDRLGAARAGDINALGDVLHRYSPVLLGRIRWLMGTEARRRAEMEDFASEVMLEAVRRLPEFELRDEASFVAWLVQIARRCIGDAVRRRHEHRFATLATAVLAANQPVAQQTSAEEAAVREESLLRVADVLEQMADERRQVIELRDFEELSFAEIATRMGRTENAVQLLHARALAELSRRLRA
jgi:RNA polymerase sigma-70 factor (ECF subfamily)